MAQRFAAFFDKFHGVVFLHDAHMVQSDGDKLRLRVAVELEADDRITCGLAQLGERLFFAVCEVQVGQCGHRQSSFLMRECR